jgi:hypothetical protein
MNVLKSMFLFLVLSLLSVVAFAASSTLEIGDEAYLSDCGGQIRVTKSAQGNGGGEQLNLVFTGVRYCSNFDIVSANGQSVGYDNKKLQGSEGNRYASFTLPKRVIELGYNNIVVVVKSNSGKHSDWIRLHFVEVAAPRYPSPSSGEKHGYVTLTLNQEAYLDACGGMVSITRSPQGNNGGEQVNLVFRGVENCSNFDILSNDGARINYPNKKLQGSAGNYHGSFTLPKFVIDYGFNNVKVVVKSDSGKHSDTIKVAFVATAENDTIPTAPTSGSSSW